MKIVKVSDKGQIAIPKSLQFDLGIQKGDEVILIKIGGKLIIEKSTKVEKTFVDDFKDLLKISENSLDKIWNNKEDDIWSSYLK